MAQATVVIAVQTLNVNNSVNQILKIGQAGRTAQNQVKKALDDIRKQLREASGTLANIRTVVTVLGVREAIRSYVELSDSMTNVRNRLAIVSRSQEDAASTMFKLKQTALDTRSEYDLVTRSYSRMAQATKGLGVSQSQTLQMTKTLQQSIAVSGATNEEAHATLIQLTQAMASNRLSADEFRSVAEQLPAVLDMISAATGKPRTELKKLGEEGKLTAAVLSYSILKASKDMEEKFGKTTMTISQAWTNLGTQVRFTVDALNAATGASSALANALQFLSQHTDTVADVLKFLAISTIPVLIVQAGKLAIALKTLALANPFGALAVSAGIFLSTLAEVYPDYKAFFTGPTGQKMTKEDYAITMERRKMTPGTEEYKKEQQKKDIEEQQNRQIFRRLQKQAMSDINAPGKGKRGPSVPYVPTFSEAVSNLEDEVADLQLNKKARQEMIELMKVEDAMQRNLTQAEVKAGVKKEDIRIRLNEGEREYVLQLAKSKKAAEDKEATEKALFEDWKKRQQEIKQILEDQARRREERTAATIELRGKIARGEFSEISDLADIGRARQMIESGQGTAGMSKSSAMNRLEIAELDARKGNKAKSPRQQWLEEVEGLGKFKADLESIFGPDGMIATGFASAVANSIVFEKSFKKSINSLGKAIQFEIIQTLVQGLIRMSVLGLLGGGKSSVPIGIGGIIRENPYGKGSAAGGYVSGPRTRIMGYHHGGEYIVNARATEQNRDVLEAINAGKPVVGKSAAASMQVTVHSYGVDVQTQQTGPNQMIMIARQVMHQEVPGLVAGSMTDANNKISRSLVRNNNITRSR